MLLLAPAMFAPATLANVLMSKEKLTSRQPPPRGARFHWYETAFPSRLETDRVKLLLPCQPFRRLMSIGTELLVKLFAAANALPFVEYLIIEPVALSVTMPRGWVMRGAEPPLPLTAKIAMVVVKAPALVILSERLVI